MRSSYVLGLSIVAVAVGLSVWKTRSATAQHTVPAPPGGSGYAVVRHLDSADDESNEMAQLRALDARLADEAQSLVKQLADASEDKQRAELKGKLEEKLTQQFDAQQRSRELEVAHIEAKVKKLRGTITKRNEARRTIIEKRLDQLLRESEGLGWNSPATGPATFGTTYIPQSANFYSAPAGQQPLRVFTAPRGR